MSPAITAVVGAGAGAVGAIILAFLSSWLNRDKDDAAVADQVSKAWTPLVAELRTEVAETKAECVECRTELGQVKRVLRAWVRAYDAQDPATIEDVVAAARELL